MIKGKLVLYKVYIFQHKPLLYIRNYVDYLHRILSEHISLISTLI